MMREKTIFREIVGFVSCSFICFVLMIAHACGGSSGSSGSSSGGAPPVSIPAPASAGISQKGPFSSGSNVTIYELDSALVQTGASYSTETVDDLGSFSIPTNVSSDYIEIVTQGFYYDEVGGSLSDANLTLRTKSALETDSGSLNVNILTTLAKDRTDYLISHGGMAFSDARTQAEGEVLDIFCIDEESLSNFDQMDISQTGTSNAILLAISATLQGDNTVAELSELISAISLDIKEDGTLDSVGTIDEIRANGAALNTFEIRTNLENRYAALGSTVVIPAFEDYVDSDGDCTINQSDDDTLSWTRATSAAGFTARQYHSVVSYDSKMWLIGGEDADGELNDVWTSTDGVTWTEVTSAAGWSARKQQSVIVFNNKIFLMGGSASGVAQNDVWSTTDGVTWTQETAAAWGEGTSVPSSFVLNNELYVIGGSADQGGILNDQPVIESVVWKTSDGAAWTQVVTSIPEWSTWFTWLEGSYMTSAVFSGTVYAMTGDLSSSVASSPDGADWTYTVYYGELGKRVDNQLLVHNGALYVVGGDKQYPGSGEPYAGHFMAATDGTDWSVVNVEAAWAYRYRHASVSFDGKLWIIGGRQKEYNDDESESTTTLMNDIWYFGMYE